MAVTSNPTALEMLEEEGIERAAVEKQPYAPTVQEFENHVRTYRDFIRGVTIFVAHVAVILIALAYFFG
ncbi:aa3-type cytochrome c oxidase subunit IV [Hyphomicrobium sp. 99]|uniref:aa3-type cytochrome c oxidase subunit IV n=1 Tax=Hyphomicrobium sp. 99 TaxID=1163419 RepID=UPI0018CFBBB0|nr:aa3-type cytochrome c oxidase subunit IV [Hyphomicrobium sp. 99]